MRTILRSTATVLTLALAACSGGGGASSGASVVPETVQPPTVPQASATAIGYGAEALKGAAYRGVAQLKSLDFGVLVKLRDAPGLLEYAKAVSDPRSGSYRQFLTPAEVADRFGASAKDYASVAKFFTDRGLSVMGWKQRELLRVHGSQKAVEAALGAHFAEYTRNGRTFHSLTSPPVALGSLPVSMLVGTTTYARNTHKPVKLTSIARTGYSPQQVAAAFDYTGAYRLGYGGAGINVGIIGTGPIDPVDLATFKALYHVGGASTVTQVNVTNANSPLLGPPLTFAPPPPTTDTCTIPATGPDATCNPEDIEAQLDTQQIATLARDANVLFYLAYAPNGDGMGNNYEGIDLSDYEIQQAIQDNRVDIISMSYGGGEQDNVGYEFVLGTNGLVDPTRSLGPVEFATLAALGISSFASSGDYGSNNCLPFDPASYQNDLCVSYPATDQNVVAIGGVNAPLAGNGRFIGPITGWGLQTGGGSLQSASGGGVSLYFPAPAYQLGASGVAGSTRNTPDISLVGDGFTGVATVFNARYADGGTGRLGGTSVAAPEAAAMWALVLQACKVHPTTCSAKPGTGGVSYRLGNPNPLLYGLYADKTKYASTFFDVLFGNNAQLPNCADPSSSTYPCPVPNPTLLPGYSATNGYDRITGIGVPFARPLIKAIAGV